MSARSTTLPSAVTRTLRAAVLVVAGAGVALGVSSGVAHADTVHGPYTLTTSQCATCHRAHTGQGPMLLDTTGSAALKSPTTTLCLTCHNGTGARPDLVSEYATATPNDEATRSYFQHEVTTVTTHTLAANEEFLGVLDRHSECTDCHNPHSSGTAGSAATAGQPWTASQRILGTSGVQVTNGAPRTFTFLNGTSATMTAEYQLCLKCHSGYTKLLPDVVGEPSKNMTDVAAEFDPANTSYHPVEAAGRNTTPAMVASLAGTSQFKLWNFSVGGTVRCTHCHSSTIVNPATSGQTAGGTLAPHTSSYRGILVQKYEDRVLNAANASFSEANFALCFLCHTDSPFISGNHNGHELLGAPQARRGHQRLGQHQRHHRHAGSRTGQRAVRRVPLPPALDVDRPGAGDRSGVLRPQRPGRQHGHLPDLDLDHAGPRVLHADLPRAASLERELRAVIAGLPMGTGRHMPTCSGHPVSTRSRLPQTCRATDGSSSSVTRGWVMTKNVRDAEGDEGHHGASSGFRHHHHRRRRPAHRAARPARTACGRDRRRRRRGAPGRHEPPRPRARGASVPGPRSSSPTSRP